MKRLRHEIACTRAVEERLSIASASAAELTVTPGNREASILRAGSYVRFG